jgi:hypothetical protein
MNRNWKEELKLEEANVLNNNVEKDDQIIYEEQVNRDQEPNEDKLPSKQSRRLPTMRHYDFLWLVINMNH